MCSPTKRCSNTFLVLSAELWRWEATVFCRPSARRLHVLRRQPHAVPDCLLALLLPSLCSRLPSFVWTCGVQLCLLTRHVAASRKPAPFCLTLEAATTSLRNFAPQLADFALQPNHQLSPPLSAGTEQEPGMFGTGGISGCKRQINAHDS